MKKLFLIKAFGLLFLCFSLNTTATTIQEYTKYCPIGGETYTHFYLTSYTSFGMRLDLKPIGTFFTDVEPLPVCANGFIDYQDSYTEIELTKLEELINSPEYQSLRNDNTDYFMLAKIEEHMGINKLQIAGVYLSASYEAENNYPREKYLEYLNLTIDNLNAAIDTSDRDLGFEVNFLLIELYRLTENFEISKLKLNDLKANYTAVGYEKVLIDFEEELIDSQNSQPQSSPPIKS